MSSIIPDKVKGVSFTKRPGPVPYSYRIIYKVSQIALILFYCCGRKACSLQKVHIVATALSSKSEMDKLLLFLKGSEKSIILVRFDPAINRAIDFALAEGIILRQKNGLFKLTEKGKEYIVEVIKDKSLFIFEKNNLEQIGLKLTEDRINQLISTWSGSDV
ncbi:hypothetical protein PP175_03925 [Aneurinibacillus sp. Ricciae_BoGa-3]|uniref:hypothetical protein n=1 Tax=Aneurinibacillus sp. Ricciae_BoGa-3 TaxID=3022697 RepID=UPI0023401C10|nr:hypothetical protein [Aneurinibacillus sp. Ricciae_BoGa-3]WCK55145.1 hypothetical protein PP175_03925 [Aneurinibacillus sp. Ricciae_BoGa-3]